jgi:hypothetical protein
LNNSLFRWGRRRDTYGLMTDVRKRNDVGS